MSQLPATGAGLLTALKAATLLRLQTGAVQGGGDEIKSLTRHLTPERGCNLPACTAAAQSRIQHNRPPPKPSPTTPSPQLEQSSRLCGSAPSVLWVNVHL